MRTFTSCPSSDRRQLAVHNAELIAKARHTIAAADERTVAAPTAITSIDQYEVSLAAIRAQPPSEEAEAHREWDLNFGPFALELYPMKALSALVEDLRGKLIDNVQVEGFLTRLAQTPPRRQLARPPAVEAIEALADRFPNFSEVVEYLASQTALAHLGQGSPLQFTPMILDGPPGIGKTEFSNALAGVLGVNTVTLQMSHATSSFSLGGLNPGFSNGGPGLIARTVALGPSVDALILVDELDKMPADEAYEGALYSLLEPSTAKAFVDDGLQMPLNCAALRWVCTTNDASRLAPVLLSRCEIFAVAAPTPDQARNVVRNIYQALRQGPGWGAFFSPSVSDDVIDMLAAVPPRQVRRRLLAAFGHAARQRRGHLSPADCVAPFVSVKRSPGFF